MKLSARTYATPSAIESLSPEWRALEQGTPEATGFQSPSWRLCCSGGRAAPRIVAVREARKLVMLLPLQVETLWGVKIACWLGEPLAQYGDALALPGSRRAEWLAAAEAEIARWKDVDLIAMTRLRADGVLASAGAPLKLSNPARHSAPFVDLGVASGRRRSMERRQKKMRKYGPLRFEVAGTSQERREAAAQALAFKRQWLRDRGRFSVSLSNPQVGESLLALAENGALRANRLWAGDRLVSVELGVKFGDCYRSLIGAFDVRMAEASPGHALTLHMLDHLAREGVTRFDFLPPADPYKMQFATGSSEMGALYRPMNAKGALAAFALARLRPLAKGCVQSAAQIGLSVETAVGRMQRVGAAFAHFAGELSDRTPRI
jgi:CelD/BcsL family acetyltransferase involved in cellulose biosynthesis